MHCGEALMFRNIGELCGFSLLNKSMTGGDIVNVQGSVINEWTTWGAIRKVMGALKLFKSEAYFLMIEAVKINHYYCFVIL